MTNTQIRWAMTHDWYIGVAFDGCTITVRHDLHAGETLRFTDFDKLKIWAGY